MQYATTTVTKSIAIAWTVIGTRAGLHSATAYLFTSSVGNHVGELYNIIYSVATHLSLQIVIVVGIISAVVDAKSLFGGK